VTVDAKSGRVLNDLAAHEGAVTAIRAVPNQPWHATAGVDGAARLWKHEADASWTLLTTMSCGGEVIGMAIRPTADAIAITARPSNLLWFSLPGGRPLASSTEPSIPWRPAFSADGRRVAAGTWDRSIHIWSTPFRSSPATNTTTVTALVAEQVLVGHTQLVLQEVFDRTDGSRLASVSNDGSLRIWDTGDLKTEGLSARRRLLATFNPDAGDSVAVACLPPTSNSIGVDNPILVTGHGDGRVRLWDWQRLDSFIEGQRNYQVQQRAKGLTSQQ
jgi:WD40 repeat protein